MSGLLRVRGLTKRFGSVEALAGVDLDVEAGEVHAVLGENGAGKSTLMSLLYGVLAPDAGKIVWRGEEVRLRSPDDALALGIGMVHQHFMLVPALSVWENVWLAHPARPRFRLGRAAAREAVRDLARRYELDLDGDALVARLSVGERQRVEIAKALSRRVELLVLDEPTAVLAPPEVRSLFRVIRELAGAGTSVLFVSHKLEEVLEISGRVTVMRRGRVVASGETADTDAAELTRRIMGDAAGDAGDRPEARSRSERATPGTGRVLLAADELHVDGRVPLDAVSFELRGGELLGVAGVDGNGQDELVAALAGLVPARKGRVLVAGEDVTRLDAGARARLGLSVLPGDRSREGLVADLAVWENLALRDYGARWARRHGWVVPERHVRRARELVRRFDVRAESVRAPAATLSGGNQQKLLLGRELAADPRVLVLFNPTRGLDVAAQRSLIRTLHDLRDAGRAVLMFSTELDDVLDACDRVAVMYGGHWSEPDTTDRERLGAMMLGAS